CSEPVAGRRPARTVADVDAAVGGALGRGPRPTLELVAVLLAALDVGLRRRPARVRRAHPGAVADAAGRAARRGGRVLASALVARRVRHAAHDVGVRRQDVRAGVDLADARLSGLHGATRGDAHPGIAILTLDLVARGVRQAADAVVRRRRHVAGAG